jgi:hypothetical protein
MARRVKATWQAAIRSIGRTVEHHYRGNTCTGFTQYVHVSVTLEREPDRVVSIKLTPDDADKWADALILYARKVREENKSL